MMGECQFGVELTKLCAGTEIQSDSRLSENYLTQDIQEPWPQEQCALTKRMCCIGHVLYRPWFGTDPSQHCNEPRL